MQYYFGMAIYVYQLEDFLQYWLLEYRQDSISEQNPIPTEISNLAKEKKSIFLLIYDPLKDIYHGQCYKFVIV